MELTPLQIINVVEGYNKLKNQFYKDKKVLEEMQIEDSAYEINSEETQKQRELVKADLDALQQFLSLKMEQVPNITPEFISNQNNKLGTKLNLEV